MMYKASKDGFTLLVYIGDGAVLLAFDIDLKKVYVDRLAGFSILVPHAS